VTAAPTSSSRAVRRRRGTWRHRGDRVGADRGRVEGGAVANPGPLAVGGRETWVTACLGGVAGGWCQVLVVTIRDEGKSKPAGPERCSLMIEIYHFTLP
jgi:hypothetical protein